MPHCPSSAHWPLQSPGSLWIFPCPAIFSQVLIFSFCQARSRQPPRRFQRSGLHANCLSMARLPPTYIMHLVSFAQSGLHHFGSFKFRREKDCKSNASGYGRAKQPPKEEKKKKKKNDLLPCFWRNISVGGLTGGTSFEGWVACDRCCVRPNFISQLRLLRASIYRTVHHVVRRRYRIAHVIFELASLSI